MPFPVMTLTNATATGDLITGPGAVGVLVKAMPVACMGDMVAGTVCTGAVSVSTSPNKIMRGRPVACMTSPVTGVNPITGIPVATVCAVTPNVNDIF